MYSLMCCVVFMIIICSYHGCSQICPLTGYHNVYHNIYHFPRIVLIIYSFSSDNMVTLVVQFPYESWLVAMSLQLS